MKARLKTLLPWAVCCAPGMAVAAVLLLGATLTGSFLGLSGGGYLLWGLAAVALFCPLSKVVMVLLMRRNMTACAPRQARDVAWQPARDLQQPEDLQVNTTVEQVS